MSNTRIYFDYASLTPIDPRVLREMNKFSAPQYANPSSLYGEGVVAKKAIAEARKGVADFIHAHPDEIVFTSGGTEANNLAIQGVVIKARAMGIKKPHIIISKIEHASVMEVANMLEKYGCEVTRVGVDSTGVIIVDELKKAIKPNTVLVSVMMVNNEIGSIQPIREIAKIVRDARKNMSTASVGESADSCRRGENSVARSESPRGSGVIFPLLHTDASQGVLFDEVYVEKLGVDLLTLDGSKVYGPRGIGCLFIKRNTPIEAIMQGGGQENGLRSGTENLPAIKGFAKALELVDKEHFSQLKWRILDMRTQFIEGLRAIRPDVTVNSSENKGAIIIERGGEQSSARHNQSDKKIATFNSLHISPHILNVSIPGIDNEFFVFQLDAMGIACSTKSSCLRDEEESYVIKAMGVDSRTSVRFSFGRWTTVGEIKRTLKTIESILPRVGLGK